MGRAASKASARRRAANRARGEARTRKRVRARPVTPGERTKVTIRCHERRLFLSPYGRLQKGQNPEAAAEAMRNFVGYAFGRAQLMYGFDFHAGVVMGDHPHYDTTDRLANRPRYKNSIHSSLARGVNAKLGRFDSLFAPGGSCDTTTPTDEETLMDLAYTDTNPVKAGLVKWGHLWPGFTTYGWRFGESRTFRLPDWFFDPDNPDNPETVTITRVRPRGIYPDLSDDELSDKLMNLCRELERAKQQEMKAQNRRFMGLKKLAKTNPWHQATSREDRFRIKPRVASTDRWKRSAALRRNRHWAEHYARSRDDFEAGLDPEFPYGTYQMRVRFNVRVADKPP